MTWTCSECGCEVVRGRAPVACRFCGSEIMIPKRRPIEEPSFDSSEGMFGQWLKCGLDRADLAAQYR